MNPETVTLQDCIENFKFKNQRVIIMDGKVIGFQEEMEDKNNG